MIVGDPNKFFDDMCRGYFSYHQQNWVKSMNSTPTFSWERCPPPLKEQFREAMKAAFNFAWTSSKGEVDGEQTQPSTPAPETA